VPASSIAALANWTGNFLVGFSFKPLFKVYKSFDDYFELYISATVVIGCSSRLHIFTIFRSTSCLFYLHILLRT
jgi:hypothetical protein